MFEVQKCILHEMPDPIKIFVVRPLNLPILFRRDNNLHASSLCISYDLI
jgi:hypothetical protein